MKSTRCTIAAVTLAAFFSSKQAWAAGGETAAQSPATTNAAAPGTTSSASFARSGSDRITRASLPGSGTVTPGYDATYGHVTALDGGSYSLSTTHDAYSGKQLGQTLVQSSDTGVKTTLSNAGNSYDALDRRVKRTVDGGQLSPTTASTDYWYGPMPLKPLSVERQDGTTKKARVIYLGDEVLAIESGQDNMQASYPVADRLGSTRAVLDGDGNTQYSLGYDEWGKTTIVGQDSAVDVSDLALLFRFQGIEQDIFPLTALGVDSTDALAWLDGIGQYHYYGRDYAAGLASFLAMDPAGASVSPYSAFGGSPANYVDPDGMAPKKAKKEARPPLSHDSLEGLIAYLRKLGIEKLLMGEVHAKGDQKGSKLQIYNVEIISRLLEGAAFGGLPLKYWQEVIGASDQILTGYKRFPSLAGQEELMDHFFTMTWPGNNPSYREKNRVNLERAKKVLGSPNVNVEFLAYDKPTRTDLTDFINHQGFAIAKTGFLHTASLMPEESYGYWLGFPWNVVDGVLKGAIQAPSEVRHPYRIYHQLWSAWWRMSNAAEDQHTTLKAALIIPGTAYYPTLELLMSNRTQVLHYFGRDSTVFEFPIAVESSNDFRHAAGYNVTIAVDPAFRASIWDYIRNMAYPHAVNFNCTGLPDCPEPARGEPKGEL